MKFTVAWANTLSQNMTLRLAVIALSLCSLFFSVVAAKLALKKPLLIERGCYSSVPSLADTKHTQTEIDAFIRVAVAKRFDSGATQVSFFISEEEENFWKKEQEDLSKKEMSQKVIVNTVKVDGPHFLVDADRLISVGKIRSALPFLLKTELSSIPRSEGNPYGLILNRVSQIEEGGSPK